MNGDVYCMDKKIIDKLLPFIGFGIFAVFAVLVLIFLSYVFLVGILVGGVFYLFFYLRRLFVKNNDTFFINRVTRTDTKKEREKGRIIEQDKE